MVWSILGYVRWNELKVTAKEFAKSNGLLTLSGEISLILGLVIVIDHPFWEWNWVGLITLIGFLFILRGIVRIGFPLETKKWMSKVSKSKVLVCLAILFIIGVYLTYMGFFS